MKKSVFLALLLIPILFSGCSSDDEDWTELNYDEIIGSWSTGIEGTHKYLNFEGDGTGYYSLLDGTDIVRDYLFDYEISGSNIIIEITYSEPHGLAGRKVVWDCQFSKNILKIKDGQENGTYKRIE